MIHFSFPLIISTLFILTSAHAESITIYSSNSLKSQRIAQVPSNDGGLNLLRCRAKQHGITWCRVHYRYGDQDITGWSTKQSLNKLQTSQSNTFEKRFGGRYSDIGKSLIVLDDGYLIGASTQSFGHGQYDAYLIKTDIYGNSQWATTIGGRGDDILEDVIEIESGDFIFSGSTTSFGNRMPSLFVGRVNSDGMQEWHRGLYLDDDNRYSGHSLALVNESNVMIAGYEDQVKMFNSHVNFHLNAVNIDGSHRWSQFFGGNKSDSATSLLRLNDGYIVAGNTNSWGEGLQDIYVVRLNEDGKRIWHRTFGFDYNEEVNQIIATKDGGFIIVGTTESFHDAAKEIFVVKIDAKGKKQWNGRYGHEDDEEGFGIVEMESGYIIVGYTKSTRNYDSQVYVLKLNKKGRVLWERTYGGVNSDEGYSIVKTKDGGILITGVSKGGPQRGEDIYLLKLDQNGNL